MNDANRWRLVTISLAFLLLTVSVAWVMREQAIRHSREQERAEWETDRQVMVRLREEQSRIIEQLDLSYDALRREIHHARARATTRSSIPVKVHE